LHDVSLEGFLPEQNLQTRLDLVSSLRTACPFLTSLLSLL
jgi:hypothetical protein